MKGSPRRREDLPKVASPGVCFLVLLMSSAAAQTLPPDSSRPLDEVIVTGSRIARPELESAVPVTVVDSTDFKRVPADSIGKILQALPLQTGATRNSQVNNGADGSTRINLRGLGDERTLVLLNGRRVVFGGLGADSSVDLNMIPLAMIERVEISPSGASAIYGADAVAGVVNILTRHDFTGIELGTDYSASDAGDGDIATAHLLFGVGGERGNFSAGTEYVSQDGVGQGARDYSRFVEGLATISGPVLHVGSPIAPQGLYRVPRGNAFGLAPGVVYTTVNGTSGRGPDDFRPFDFDKDLYNYAPYNFLQTPSQRRGLWVQGQLRLTDSVELFTEGLAQRSESRQQIAPSTYRSIETGAAPLDADGAQQIIPANNYYNPFGVDIPRVLRRIVEGGDRRFREDSRSERLLAGLRGSAGGWHWETSIVWARNRTESFETGEILRSAAALAVGPSGLDADGRVVCGVPDPDSGIVPPANIIAGCVPLNLFGGLGAQGGGTITPDQFGYISRDLHNHGINEQRLAEAILTGSLGRAPAGSIDWAFGVQYREESGKLSLDPLNSLGVSGSFGNSQLPTAASFHSQEAFVETRVPLLVDRPAAIALDVNLSARQSHFSAFGTTTTYQGGIRWSPAKTLTVRGSYAQVFRAPSTLNLYATQSLEFEVIEDPCGLDPSAAQMIHCAANGVPGGSYQQDDVRPLVQVVLGGNPALVPERGETWTAGLAIQLPWQESRASLDYYRSRLNNAIGISDAQLIANECADTGASGACKSIDRAPDGSLDRIDMRYTNLSRLSTDGIDLSVKMNRSLGRFGALSGDVAATYIAGFEQTSFIGGAAAALAGTTDGNVSWPRWRARASVDWNRDSWSASYIARYISHLRECGDTNDFLSPDDCRVVGDRVYQSVAVSRRWSSGITASAYVSNIANLPPPRVNRSGNANTDTAIYDVLGRVYSLRLSYSVR